MTYFLESYNHIFPGDSSSRHLEWHLEVCGSLGEAGTHFKVSAPVADEEAETEIEVLRVVPCPHYGYLSELKIRPITGRHHQIRQHCAEFLGAPIVNDERPLFDVAAAAWQRRTGTPLPPYYVRGGGNLFLQAVAIAFPPPSQEVQEGQVCQDKFVRVKVPVSGRFERLLRTSARAYEEGWRSTADGQTFQIRASGSFGYPLDRSADSERFNSGVEMPSSQDIPEEGEVDDNDFLPAAQHPHKTSLWSCMCRCDIVRNARDFETTYIIRFRMI